LVLAFRLNDILHLFVICQMDAAMLLLT